jgi:hypothetical protein
MVAQAGAGTENEHGDTEALCLAPTGPKKGKYTVGGFVCPTFARNAYGAVDEPPDYGDAARAAYALEAAAKYPNEKPMFAADGTMLDENGNRSIFDDVDEPPDESFCRRLEELDSRVQTRVARKLWGL